MQNIGKEYVLAKDSTLGDMFNFKVVIPKGTKVKIVGYHWSCGYKIQDAAGRTNWTWTVDL